MWRQETRRRQQAEAASRRQQEAEARGVKDPEAVKRKQKRREEMEKQNDVGGEGGLKVSVQGSEGRGRTASGRERRWCCLK